MYRIDPEHDDPTHQSINALNASGRRPCWPGCDRSSSDDPDLIEKVVPDYPAMGKRILQDNGSWLRALQKPNVELVRTRIERIVPDGVVTSTARSIRPTSSVTPPGSATTSSSRRWRSSGGTASPCASSGATSPPRTSASRCRTSRICSACTDRGRTWPSAPACSSTPNSRFTTRSEAIHDDAGLRCAEGRGPAGRARRLRRAVPAGDRPAGVVPPVDHAQPLQESRGQGLHAVAVAARAVLGVDPPRRPRATTSSAGSERLTSPRHFGSLPHS